MTQFATCESCDSRLIDDDTAMAIVTRFPEDFPGSLAILSRGLGYVICPHCKKFSHTPFHHLVVDQSGVLLIGIQPERSTIDIDALVEQASNRQQGQRPHILRVEGAKAFRRALIEVLVQPHSQLLNAFVMADEPLQWVAANEGKLNRNFFQTMVLAGTGAVQMFVMPVDPDDRDVPSFVPNEEAPDQARHVIRRKEAEAEMRCIVGQLLGYLMVHLASQALERRAMTPLTKELPERLSVELLSEERLEGAVETVKLIADHLLEVQPEGWIALAYCVEAALALACKANGVDNPRRTAWTQWCLLYDYQRRLDGNEESLLLEPELVRETVDAAAFWLHFRKIGSSLQRNRSGDEGEEEMDALLHAAGRVFPKEIHAHSEMEVRIDPDLDDEATSERARLLLNNALEPPQNSVLLRSTLLGLSRTRPQVMEKVVLDVIQRPGRTAFDRVFVLRIAIEFLNSNGHHASGRRLAQMGMDLLRDLPDDEEGRDAAIRFVNELGNVWRMAGQLADSQSAYEFALDLLPKDDALPDRRVALRNLAIVLRDQHRYQPAIQLLEGLLPGAGSVELRGLVTSLAICRNEVGQGRQALVLMEKFAAHVAGVSVRDKDVVEYVIFRAALLAQQGRLMDAQSELADVMEEARRRDHHAALMIDRDISLRIQMQQGRPDPALVEAQLDLFDRFGGGSLGTVGFNALRGLNDALIVTGQSHRAECLLHQLIDHFDSRDEPRAWQLHCMAAEHARRRGGDPAPSFKNALKAFQQGVAAAASTGDVREYVSPESKALRMLVAEVLSLEQADANDSARLWRHAADLVAAPVLTSRLRGSAGLAPALADADREDARLAEILTSGDCELIQVVASGSNLCLLRTWRHSNGTLQIERTDVGITTEEAERMTRRLAYRLSLADPTATTISLDNLAGWPDYSKRLCKAFDGANPSHMLIVVAGPLQEPAVMLALAGRNPISFVPSLAAATALHVSRPGLDEAPKRLFGFATWLRRELPLEAQALEGVAGRLEAIGRSHGIEVEHVIGKEAIESRLVAGLAHADIAWIACHGRLRREAETIELLVAHGGLLPTAEGEEQHAVGWQSLSTLERSPAAVVSSACDSGLTITNPGGERLGLERALLGAGTRAFVAPVWPVPTVAIQAVVERLIDARIREPKIPWCVHLHRMRESLGAEGLPALATEALAVFGELPA